MIRQVSVNRLYDLCNDVKNAFDKVNNTEVKAIIAQNTGIDAKNI